MRKRCVPLIFLAFGVLQNFTPEVGSSTVELIPRALVLGVFAATPPGVPDRERLNRVWGELSARQDYRQFTVTGDGAQFAGASADDALVIQPPLIQVRSTARLGAQNAADEGQVAIKTVARHMGWAQFFNLGIKHVFTVNAPNNDARGFALRHLLHADESAYGVLERGADFWGGLKFGANGADGTAYTVVVEPLIADNQLLFIDLDAQFPGPVDPDRITDKAAEAFDYATNALRQYLETSS